MYDMMRNNIYCSATVYTQGAHNALSFDPLSVCPDTNRRYQQGIFKVLLAYPKTIDFAIVLNHPTGTLKASYRYVAVPL